MINKAIDFFLNSSVFIAICSVMLSLSTYQYFNLDPNKNVISLIFFSTITVYNLARIFPMYLDKNTLLKKDKWYQENKIFLLFIVLLSSVFILYFSLKLSSDLLLYLSHLGILSLLYSLPLFKPLRDIPYLKIFLIAYVWMAVCIGLPVIEIGFNTLLQLPIILLFIQCFLFIFAITIPFDLRDKEADLRQKIKTLPQRIGGKFLLYISVFLLAISSVISIILKPEHLIFENIIFIIITIIILNSKHKESNWYFLGLLDATILLKSLIFFL